MAVAKQAGLLGGETAAVDDGVAGKVEAAAALAANGVEEDMLAGPAGWQGEEGTAEGAQAGGGAGGRPQCLPRQLG